MKSVLLAAALVCVVFVVVSSHAAVIAPTATTVPATAGAKPQFVERTGDLAFVASGTDRSALFTASGMTLRVRDGVRRGGFEMAFDGARAVRPRGERLLPALRHRITGGMSPRTETFRSFAGIVYDDPWPGIDVRFDARPGAIEWSVDVAAGADSAAARFAFRGAKGVTRTASGALAVETDAGIVLHTPPVAWQESGGRRIPVAVAFDVRATTVGFALTDHDPSLPLVIDPGFEFRNVATGLSGDDQLFDFVAGADGGVFVAGRCGFDAAIPPGKAGFDSTISGTYDGYVARFDPAGALLWATYLGGAGDGDQCQSIALDPQGRPAVVTLTVSADYPVSAGPRLTRAGAGYAATLLEADGASLIWSGWLGPNGIADRIACAPDGAVFVAGHANGDTFVPTIRLGAATTKGLWVEKISTAGQRVFTVLMNGPSDRPHEPFAIAVDGAGAAHVGGRVHGRDGLPPADVSVPYRGGNTDAYVLKLAPDGASVAFATHIGGSASETATSIALGADGSVYAAGGTSSSDDSFPRSFLDFGNGFAAKLSPTGQILWNLSVGSEPALDLDAAGRVYVQSGDAVYRLQPSGAFVSELKFGGFGLALASPTGSRCWVANGFEDDLRLCVNQVEDVPVPEQVAANATGPRGIRVTWVPARGDETAWSLERQDVNGDGRFLFAGELPGSATSFDDTTVTPDTLYRYRLTAARGEDRSCLSAEAEARTPDSFSFGVLTGAQTYRKGTGTEILHLKLEMPASGIGAFDPLTLPLSVSVLGTSGEGATIGTIAADIGWSVTKRGFRWRSEPDPGALIAQIDYLPAKRRLVVRMLRHSISGLPDQKAVVRVSVGDDVAIEAPVWTEKKRGLFVGR